MQVVASPLSLSKENPAPTAQSVFERLRWLPWAVLLIAAIFRIAWLDLKPAHFDEGINGWFVDQMTKNGFYEYDPTNYHGPLHFYIEFISLTVFGRNLWALRMPVVLAGMGTVWMAWAFRRHIGNRAALFAALGMAVSPAFVFYERYAIHETWLVLGLMLFVWGILEIQRHGTRRGLYAFIGGVTLCVLTKETYLIHFIAAILAYLACTLWRKIVPEMDPIKNPPHQWTDADVIKATALALFALLFFYSGNFFHWKGVEGIITTFSTWVHTGVESGDHVKKTQQLGPINYYWLFLAWRYEPFMLVGVLVSLLTLARNLYTTRWLAAYGVASLCAYSIISYKTPWCIIAMAWPFYLMAGIAVDRLLATRPRLIYGTIALAGLGYTIARSIDLNLQNYDNDAEEYVYVQTWRDVSWVLNPIQSVLARDPSQMNMIGRVHLESYFPLPWYFGGMPRVTCPKPGAYLKDEDAGFIITEASRKDEMAAHLTEAYYTVPFRLRAGLKPCIAFFNTSLFAPEFNNRVPDLAARDAAEE